MSDIWKEKYRKLLFSQLELPDGENLTRSVIASTKIPKELNEDIENLKSTLNKVNIKGIVKTIRKD